uniref:Uncharacterized protein n=1 Tax=Rhizophora mucronata TaxID=61149 RepID=A0A2P2P317_RHIMU
MWIFFANKRTIGDFEIVFCLIIDYFSFYFDQFGIGKFSFRMEK